jgi:hypothetical protein
VLGTLIEQLLSLLMEKGYLEPNGQGRGTKYTLMEMFHQKRNVPKTEKKAEGFIMMICLNLLKNKDLNCLRLWVFMSGM